MNWYDLPTYYDVSFSHEMKDELIFLKELFNEYCTGGHPRLLEPACGTGRLIMPLSRSGFHCTGFDLNEHALKYLKEKLERNCIKANIFNEDMADFNIKGKKFDAAYCTLDTFRHLLAEKQAKQHLINVAKSLKKNAIYILGLHLNPKQGVTDKVMRWTAKRGRLTVNTSMKMFKPDIKKKTETIKVILRANRNGVRPKYESIYKLHTYTTKQFYALLADTNAFEVVNIYDDDYDISEPIKLNTKSGYRVFVLRKI